MFVWLLLYENIMVDKVRFKRGFVENSDRPLCAPAEETCTHMLRLRDCPLGLPGIYTSGSPVYVLKKFFDLNISDWISSNCSKYSSKSFAWPDVPWIFVFLATIWQI